jgi:hypothetical protein
MSSAAALPAGYRCGGVLRGKSRVSLAVLLRLRAVLQEPLGGVLDAVAPINRGHAPYEIRLADVGPVASVHGRRVSHTGFIGRSTLEALPALWPLLLYVRTKPGNRDIWPAIY